MDQEQELLERAHNLEQHLFEEEATYGAWMMVRKPKRKNTKQGQTTLRGHLGHGNGGETESCGLGR